VFYIDLAYEKTLESSGRKADRFDLSKFVDYSGGFHEFLTSYFVLEIKKLTKKGSFLVVTEEGRPDLISYNVYGTVQLWWVLLVYNNLTDVGQVLNSTVLNYPNIADIESLYFSLPGLSKQ